MAQFPVYRTSIGRGYHNRNVIQFSWSVSFLTAFYIYVLVGKLCKELSYSFDNNECCNGFELEIDLPSEMFDYSLFPISFNYLLFWKLDEKSVIIVELMHIILLYALYKHVKSSSILMKLPMKLLLYGHFTTIIYFFQGPAKKL